MIKIQFGHSFTMNSVRQTRYAAQVEDVTRLIRAGYLEFSDSTY